MPDYKQHSVVRPDSISADALTVHLQVLEEDARVKEALEINMREEGEIHSWLDLWNAVGGSSETNPDGTTYLFVEEAGINEAMIAILCELVDTNPLLLPHVSVETAATCSKMMPDGFGGSAIFIAHDLSEVQYSGTHEWLVQQEAAYENRHGCQPANDVITTHSRPFNVAICRTGYGHRVEIFHAHSPGEAQQMALEQAGNLTYTEKASEYSVEGIWEIADTQEDPQS